MGYRGERKTERERIREREKDDRERMEEYKIE